MAQDGKDQLERPRRQGGQTSPSSWVEAWKLINREYGNVLIDLLDQKPALIVRYLAIWQWTVTSELMISGTYPGVTPSSFETRFDHYYRAVQTTSGSSCHWYVYLIYV
jgi:hypothetical protein